MLGQLFYGWDDSQSQMSNPVNHPHLVTIYDQIEENLVEGRGPHSIPGFKYGLDYISAHHRNVVKVFASIERLGLQNPLVVIQVNPVRYLTIVGNQRLCALRALFRLGRLQSNQIDCVLNDKWGAKEVFEVWPYKAVSF